MTQPSTRLPAAERRLLTVDTVIDLAAEESPDRITTEQIAQRMGITQGALFRHFPSKEAIWEAVMGQVAERLLERVERAAREAGNIGDALQAIFMAHVRFVAEHPGVPRILFGELQRPETTPARHVARMLVRHYGEHLQGLIRQGQERGELAADIAPQAAAALFIGTIQGLVMQTLLEGDTRALLQRAPTAFALLRRCLEART